MPSHFQRLDQHGDDRGIDDDFLAGRLHHGGRGGAASEAGAKQDQVGDEHHGESGEDPGGSPRQAGLEHYG